MWITLQEAWSRITYESLEKLLKKEENTENTVTTEYVEVQNKAIGTLQFNSDDEFGGF